MASAEQEGQKGLGLFDAISIIVGIVIGTTIFKVPWLIFQKTSDPWMSLTVWLLGGILALIGALCYAELATTYPRSGGDYYYLTRAYGPGMGFLFGWTQLLVVFTASIGAMAFVFGEYANKIPLFKDLAKHVDLQQLNDQVGDIGLTWEFVFACAAVIFVTFLNLLGVLVGKITQNLLTLVKIVSLSAILVAGFVWAQSSPTEWKLALPETAKFEGAGGDGIGKEFTFRNADWEVALSLTADDKKATKLTGKFKNLGKVPQKLNLDLLIRTNKDTDVDPAKFSFVDNTEIKPFSQPRLGEQPEPIKTFKDLPVPSEAERTGVYEVIQVISAGKPIGWAALAMILVLYAFGGWNDAAFVASEVRDPKRNIPRALIIGVSLITVVYLLVNTAYITGLGFKDASSFGEKGDVPARLLEHAVVQWQGDDWKGWGSEGMSILIVISALGAVSGLIFTGARVYATLGSDYTLFGWMGHWQPGKRAPILALLVQAIFTLGMIFMLGTRKGHDLINELLSLIHIEHKSKWNPDDAFEALVAHTAPVFWVFFMATGFSLFLLRARDSNMARSFSVPLYPWLPIIFCTTCAFMLFQSTTHVGWRALFAMGLVLLGIPFYWLACLFGGYRGDVEKQE